jgi:hypothetical protein
MDEITKVSFLLLDPFAWGDYRCFSPSRVRPRRVRPVRWQIKGCQTTEPRTFDSGFSGKVNLSLLVYGTPTYLLTSQCVPYYLFRVSPLCTTKLDIPSLTLTRRSSFCRVRPEAQLEVLLLALLVVYAVRTYAPSLELVLYTTRQFPYAPSGAGNLTTS